MKEKEAVFTVPFLIPCYFPRRAFNSASLSDAEEEAVPYFFSTSSPESGSGFSRLDRASASAPLVCRPLCQLVKTGKCVF